MFAFKRNRKWSKVHAESLINIGIIKLWQYQRSVNVDPSICLLCFPRLSISLGRIYLVISCTWHHEYKTYCALKPEQNMSFMEEDWQKPNYLIWSWTHKRWENVKFINVFLIPSIKTSLWYWKKILKTDELFNSCICSSTSHLYHFISHSMNLCYITQGFQYFSSEPVLHHLQAVLFIKIWTFLWISYTTLLKIRRYQRPF